MEELINFINSHASIAHYLVFSALMLAGINIPISEDLLIIISALLAANVVPENTYLLFFAVFLGCYLSDWVSYWIGRTLGRKLWDIKWFSKTVPRKKLDQTQKFYDKYGFWTLLVGRFIPFGVRNCLFITAGMGKMPFPRFLLSDGIACLLSNSTLFWLAYTLGKNLDVLLYYIKTFNIAIFSLFIVAGISFFWIRRRRKRTEKSI